MRFFLFSDFHCVPRVFRGGTPQILADFMARAQAADCDFMIHVGDFCNVAPEQTPLIDAYNQSTVPAYHVLGNHDADSTTCEAVLAAYRMGKGYYFFDVGGYRIIVLNPNYYYTEEGAVPYSGGNYYKNAATRDYLPGEQLAWLEETIATAPGHCLLFSHESLERESGVKNREAVRALIRRANERRTHSVLACFCGHYHRDYHTVIEDVLYMEVNSVAFDWIPKVHSRYPAELCEKAFLLSHTIAYEVPLSAVVTVEGTTVTVEGTEGRPLFGVTHEDVGCDPFDECGRAASASISSFSVTL